MHRICRQIKKNTIGLNYHNNNNLLIENLEILVDDKYEWIPQDGHIIEFDKIYIRRQKGYRNSLTTPLRFKFESDINVSDRIASLLDADCNTDDLIGNFSHLFDVLNHESSAINANDLIWNEVLEAKYYSFFENNRRLETIPKEIKIYRKQSNILSRAFYGCEKLTKAPKIQVTPDSCGFSMFSGTFKNCTSLSTPAEIIGLSCLDEGQIFVDTYANCPQLYSKSIDLTFIQKRYLNDSLRSKRNQFSRMFGLSDDNFPQ